MKGKKENKGDGNGSQRTRGGASGGGGSANGSVVENEPLFPRLHVKETELGWPRAPPRNKMALYEQFTFPSHRFVPPSAALHSSGLPGRQSTYNLQGSSFEGSGYVQPPNYAGMPWLPYMPINTMPPLGTGPALNGNSMFPETQEQEAPCTLAADSERPSSNGVTEGAARSFSHSIVRRQRSASSKKARSNDDCTVPTYTPSMPTSPVPPIPFCPPSIPTWRTWQQPQNMDSVKTCMLPSLSSDDQMESLGPMAGGDQGANPTGTWTRHDDVTNMECSTKALTDNEEEEEESGAVYKQRDPSHLSRSYAEQSDSHNSETKQRSHRHYKQKKALLMGVISGDEGLRSCATASGECLTVSENAEISLPQKNVGQKAVVYEVSQVRELLPPANKRQTGSDNREKALGTDGQKLKKCDDPSECRSNSAEDSEHDMEKFDEAELSAHSHSEIWSDSEDSDDGSELIIKPKDIIKSIGEEAFWKTSKLIQRQQRIFSGQVFELHRLVKVQLLLTRSPNLSGEDGGLAVSEGEPEDLSETGDEDEMGDEDETIHMDQSSGDHADALETQKSTLLTKQPDNDCPSLTSRECLQPCGMDSLPSMFNAAQVPSMLNPASGVPAAPWGYPPFPNMGVNNWFGCIPASGGGYFYKPYPGAFPQSSSQSVGAYHGPYGPLMCAPSIDTPSLVSFGMPGYEQRPDLMQNMYRYNPFRQQWPAAMFCPPMTPNADANWCSPAAPMPYPDPTNRGPPGWYDESCHPSFLTPVHQNSSTPIAASHPPVFPVQYPMHPSWVDPSSGQQAELGLRFPAQTQWVPLAGTCQTSGVVPQRLADCPSGQVSVLPWIGPSSGQQPGCEGERLTAYGQWSLAAGACQTSAPVPQRPIPYPSGQVSVAQQVESEGAHGLQCRDQKSSQDSECGAAEGSTGLPNGHCGESNDRVPRKNGSNGTPSKGSRDTCFHNQTSEGDNPVDRRRDIHALPCPVFSPWIPAENGNSSSHPSSTVIKAVPRAIGATAESAAEILLSIQKQRQE